MGVNLQSPRRSVWLVSYRLRVAGGCEGDRMPVRGAEESSYEEAEDEEAEDEDDCDADEEDATSADPPEEEEDTDPLLPESSALLSWLRRRLPREAERLAAWQRARRTGTCSTSSVVN